MNWRHDPRIHELLQKTTIQSLFSDVFQRVYGPDTKEIQEMERKLEFILEKYSENDALYEKLLENDDPPVNECLDTLYHDKTLNSGMNHSPETLLIIAKLFSRTNDFRLACELIYCSASLGIQKFITDRQLKVKVDLYSLSGKRGLTERLSDDIRNRLSVFELCHNSFYSNDYNASNVDYEFKNLNVFLEQLRDFQLTDEKKKELEEENFDE